MSVIWEGAIGNTKLNITTDNFDAEAKLAIQELSFGLAVAVAFGIWQHSIGAGFFAFLVWMRKFSD